MNKLVLIFIFLLILLLLFNIVNNNEYFNYFDNNNSSLNYNMGGNGFKLTDEKKKYPLMKNSILYHGYSYPLEHDDDDMKHNDQGPYVTGLSSHPKSMFVFKYNQCNTGCCPSTYTCSRGCVCSNDSQNNFITERGSSNSTFE